MERGWLMVEEKNQVTNDKKLSLREQFLIEFYSVIVKEKGLIKYIVKRKLGKFPEAADTENAVSGCIADIESIVTKQLNASIDEISKRKECTRKLREFKRNSDYVKKYVLEATKSYCRKKQHYWGHGKNKADITKGETHKTKKAGLAARVHGTGDTNEVDLWITSIATSELNIDFIESDTIEKLNGFFQSIGLNNEKIRCFWDRVDGMTFVEMASEVKNPNASPDKYRKRYKRLMKNLEPHLKELMIIFRGRFD